jgi:hypothetical protein
MSCSCCAELVAELGREELFDEGVEAARNACVAGAPLASAAITASAWYDNPLTGARAVLDCMAKLGALGESVDDWLAAFAPAPHPETCDEWSPGFGFVSPCASELLSALACRLAACAHGNKLRSFQQYRQALGRVCGPLNPAGLAALVFADHGFSPDDAERRFLLARIDVAMHEAARARKLGVGRFPFFSESYVYEGATPPARKLDLSALMQKVLL